MEPKKHKRPSTEQATSKNLKVMVKNKLEELMQVLNGVSVGLAYIVSQGT